MTGGPLLQVWRLCRKKNIAFDGEGSRLAGGRWNRRGTAVVYTSATLSLAVLEYFVNLPRAAAPQDLVAIAAEVPKDHTITSVEESALPRGWRKYPAPETLAEIGTRWFEERKTPILAVPSAVVPQEKNYLLNPVHPRFREIRIEKPEPLSLDTRMWKA
jgi:RES domain-containing protein